MPASAWAVAKAEAVCADSVWTDELVERMALALDEIATDRSRWAEALSLATPVGQENFGPEICRQAIEREREHLKAALNAAEAALSAERQRAEAGERLLETIRDHLASDGGTLAAIDAFLSASPPAAPPEACDPLEGVVPVAYELTDVSKVRVEWRGIDSWAVVDGGYVLGRDGDWEYEPRPSNRTDEFKAATRWPSVAEAVAALRARKEER